jgi:hypothetical protein
MANTKNVKAKAVEVGQAIVKGSMAVGIVLRVTDGVAEDFMSEAQYIARQCQPNEPYTEVEIAVEGQFVTKTMKDYTRVGNGVVSPNTAMGKFCSLYELAEDAEVNMIAREVEGKNGGKSYVVWDIVE